MNACRFFLISLLALLLTPVAHAQTTSIPTGNPLQTLPRVSKPDQAPKVRVRVKHARNQRLEQLLSTTIAVRNFKVSGVQSIPFPGVAAIFHPLQGKTITVRALLAATRKCTQQYIDHDYPLSFCFLPAQDFADGTVRVVAVEGYVARVRIKGDAGSLEPRIRAIAAHIVGQRPLQRDTFERYVQILGLLPGASIKVNAPAPKTTDGATQLTLDVQRKRLDASAGVDFNHPGTQSLLTGTENALTSFGEQLSLSALYPRGRYDATYYAARYKQPLGSDGLYLHLGGSRYRGSPGNGGVLPAQLRHRVRQNRVSLKLNYPLWLDHAHALFINGGLYAADQSDRYSNVDNGAALELETMTRVIHAGVRYRHVGKKRQRAANLDVAHGLNALGASSRVRANIPTQAETDVDVDFVRVNLGLTQADTLPAHFGSVLRLSAQYSPDRLPISEKTSFGGPRYARAYDPGVASGDSGWGASAELNRPFKHDGTWLKVWTPYLLGEYAHTFNHDVLTRSDTLVSLALGLRLSDKKHYSVDLSLAQPLRDRPSGNDPRRSTRADLSFSYHFP